MVTRWRRRRIRRQLAGLIGAGEELLMVERLLLGGWWVKTGQALYVTHDGEWTRIALGQIQSVQWRSGQSTVTIRTSTDKMVLISARPRSGLAASLSAPAEGS